MMLRGTPPVPPAAGLALCTPAGVWKLLVVVATPEEQEMVVRGHPPARRTCIRFPRDQGEPLRQAQDAAWAHILGGDPSAPPRPRLALLANAHPCPWRVVGALVRGPGLVRAAET